MLCRSRSPVVSKDLFTIYSLVASLNSGAS